MNSRFREQNIKAEVQYIGKHLHPLNKPGSKVNHSLAPLQAPTLLALTHTAGSEGGGAKGHPTWLEPLALAIPPCMTHTLEPRLPPQAVKTMALLAMVTAITEVPSK